jgi:hypothetical protein
MDTTLLLPAVSALSALLGVALSSYVQFRNQRSNQAFQLDSDAIKHGRERLTHEKEEALQRLSTAHKLLSKTAREFSITTLDILWRSRMTDSEYDARYLSACLEMDELRALAGLYEHRLSEDIEHMNGQMNIFWGNFKNVLHQTALGNNVDHMTPCLICAHNAADEIGRKAISLKGKLSTRVEEVRNGA